MLIRKAITYLAGDGVEEGVDDALGESALLVLVHIHDLAPVRSDLRQVEALAEVDQVEDILLEARSTETDRGAEELVANTRIETDSVCDLVDVGTGDLTDGGEGVDGRDTLGEHGVGGELGKLGRPEANGEDLLSSDVKS